MGYDLISYTVSELDRTKFGEYPLFENGYISHFYIDIWPVLLKLAQAYGWKPAGTRLYIGDGKDIKRVIEWDGNYLDMAGQIVMDEDAASLADALDRALPDIPDHEIPGKWKEQKPDQLSPMLQIVAREIFGENETVVAINRDMSALELLSGFQKVDIVCFIKLCRKGFFYIK
jgi:hypothetical protein